MLRYSTERLVRKNGRLYLNPRLVGHCLEFSQGGYASIAAPATADLSFKSVYRTMVVVVYFHSQPANGTEWYVQASRVPTNSPTNDGRWRFQYSTDGSSNPVVNSFVDEGASTASCVTDAIRTPMLGWNGLVYGMDNNGGLPYHIFGPIGEQGEEALSYSVQATSTDSLKVADRPFDMGDRGDGTSATAQMCIGFSGIFNKKWSKEEAAAFVKNLELPLHAQSSLMMYPGNEPDGLVPNFGTHVSSGRRGLNMTYVNKSGLPHQVFIPLPLLPVEQENPILPFADLAGAPPPPPHTVFERRFSPLILR